MRFTPKNEDELNPLIPAGVYDAEVVKAEEKESKKGNPMIAITLRVFMPNGDTVLLNDWLMEAMLEKLLQFCNAAGLRAIYDQGELRDDDCVGKSVRVNVKIKTDEVHGEQNQVKGYHSERPPTTEPSRPPVAKKSPEQANRALQEAANVKAGDEDVPF